MVQLVYGMVPLCNKTKTITSCCWIVGCWWWLSVDGGRWLWFLRETIFSLSGNQLIHINSNFSVVRKSIDAPRRSAVDNNKKLLHLEHAGFVGPYYTYA